MFGKRVFRVALAAAASLTLFAGNPASAQSYPHKPVRLVLPFTAGSPNDVLARLVAPHVSSRLRHPLVVDNRPGGGTATGVKAAMTAEPDGYTLLFTNSPTHLIVPLASRAFAYDPIEDFTAVALVATSSNVIVISPAVPATSIQEFVSFARANPGKLNFGFGQGTLPHLIGEMFKLATGTDITNIPYRGGAQAIVDLLAGRIQLNIGTLSTLLPLIRDGKVRAIAVTSTSRSPDLPDVPTMIESGFASVTTVTHFGILGPAGLPANVVTSLNDEINESLKSAELRASLIRLGFEPVSGSPRDFSTLLASEVQKWTPIIKAIGFQMD